MMVVRRDGTPAEHAQVTDLPRFLERGDLLVVNRTRVLPARLFARKATGAALEIFLLRPWGKGTRGDWEALISPGRRVKGPCEVDLLPRGKAVVKQVVGDGHYRVAFKGTGPFKRFLEEAGHVPLPPYIKRADEASDKDRYQTLFAREDGSVAAPTAGLHFTPALLAALKARGVGVAEVVLHVGLGTFLAVESENVEGHVMHKERFEVGTATVRAVARTKKAGHRVVAVGTTVCRALEAAAQLTGTLRATKGETDIFIKPGYTFRVVDGLFTNFHQSRSTLLMLVSAFAGRERVLAAYREAIREGYRFFSYGDATLFL